MTKKRRYLDENPPYATYQQPVEDSVIVPYNPNFVPTYNLPEISVVDSSLPKAKATDANVQRYADAVANGDIKLTQIPDAELRNKVRSKPIVDKIREDTDKTALPILAGTVGIPAGIIGASYAAPTVWSVLNNPIVNTAQTIHGAITAPRNIKQGVRNLREGDYGKGALDLGLTALDLYGAGKTAKRIIKTAPVQSFIDRTAEAMVRQGDALQRVGEWDYKGMLNYMFRGGKHPELAYKAGLYSGVAPTNYSNRSMKHQLKQGIIKTDDIADNVKPHKGDVVDAFFGKPYNVEEAVDKSIPKSFEEYIAKNYPNKKIKVYDLGDMSGGIVSEEAAERAIRTHGTEGLPYSQGDVVMKDGVPLVDVGGHKVIYSKEGDNFIANGYDIWKFKGSDLNRKYGYGRLGSIVGDFIDSRGNPLIHKWRDIYPMIKLYGGSLNKRKLEYGGLKY